MKQENVLKILMYLFENHMGNDCRIQANQESLIAELEQVGFQMDIIDKAFDWLDGLIQLQKNVSILTPSATSFRAYTPQECLKMPTECRGFISFLEAIHVLTPSIREVVIDRVMNLDEDEVSVNQIKWVTLMVLFNQSGADAALACMEQLVLGDMSGSEH